MSKDYDELMPNYTPINNNVVVQSCPNKCCDTGSQAPGIRFAFAQDSSEREVVLGTLITLQPIQTSVGDRVKWTQWCRSTQEPMVTEIGFIWCGYCFTPQNTAAGSGFAYGDRPCRNKNRG